MILWRNIKFFSLFNQFDSDPRFPLFLLYVRWKSGVTFVRRCFRDDRYQPSVSVLEQDYEKMYTPVQSIFTVGKWGVGGSHLHGYVILMKIQENISRL